MALAGLPPEAGRCAPGGWAAPDDVAAPPQEGIQVTLPGLLSALYPGVAAAERWSMPCDTLDVLADEARITAGIITEVPGVLDHVSDLERCWNGPGGVRALLGIIATDSVSR